jgi:hypothetical protein
MVSMASQSIEDFLGLTPEDIQNRIMNVLKDLPTRPGTAYIEQRLNEFKVQPWPFILYLAYWDPNSLQEHLDCYRDYDGAENKAVIMEKLREEYIFSRMWVAAEKHKRSKNSDINYDKNNKNNNGAKSQLNR